MSTSPAPQHENMEDETGIDRSLDDIMDSGILNVFFFFFFSFFQFFFFFPFKVLVPMKCVVISNVDIALVETAVGSNMSPLRINLKMLI